VGCKKVTLAALVIGDMIERGYDPYNSLGTNPTRKSDTIEFTSEYDANRKLADSLASQQFERK
jgi:hypothetical protein